MPAISSDTNFNGVNPQDLDFINSEGSQYNVIYRSSSSNYSGNVGGKSGADAICDSDRPIGYKRGYAFARFDTNNEIQDLPTTAGINTNLNIRSVSNNLIANNWSDLLDGSIPQTLYSLGVFANAGARWMSFSDINGAIKNSCNGGTDNSSSYTGTFGAAGNNDSRWIDRDSSDSCSTATRNLLCIAKP